APSPRSACADRSSSSALCEVDVDHGAGAAAAQLHRAALALAVATAAARVEPARERDRDDAVGERAQLVGRAPAIAIRVGPEEELRERGIRAVDHAVGVRVECGEREEAVPGGRIAEQL